MTGERQPVLGMMHARKEKGTVGVVAPLLLCSRTYDSKVIIQEREVSEEGRQQLSSYRERRGEREILLHK